MSDTKEVESQFVLSHLQMVLEFIPRAESKCAVISGAGVGMLAILAANLPATREMNLWSAIVLPATVLLGLCLLKCHLAIKPSLAGGTDSLVYFGSIAKMDEAIFLERYSQLSNADLVNQMGGQIWRNSKIVQEKYRHVSHAFNFLMAAIPFWIAAIAVLSMKYSGAASIVV